jgi:hypothetical protein
MNKKVTYTSTLPEDILNSVNEYAEKYHISKNKIVEMALRHYFFNTKKNDFRNGFKNASCDPDMKEMTDAGMADYFDIIRQFERDGI